MRPSSVLLLLAISFGVSAAQLGPVYRDAPPSVQHNEKPVLMWSAKPSAVITLDAPVRSAAHAENQIGIVRRLESASPAAGTRGLMSFRSSGADRVRLHLRDVSFGEMQVLWVAGSDGPPIAFGGELLGAGGLLSPPGAGDTITLG